MRAYARCLPVSLQIHTPRFTTLLSVPGIRQQQQSPVTPLSLVNSEPWEIRGKKESEVGYIVPQFPPYRVCCIHSAKGHDFLQLGSGVYSLLPLLSPQSGNSSALLVWRFSTTLCFSTSWPHLYTEFFIQSSLNYPTLSTPSVSCWGETCWKPEWCELGREREIRKDGGGLFQGLFFKG